jgi:hypothetical protein
MSNDLTIEQLLRSVLESAEADAPGSALYRTPDCPSYSRFESHARGVRYLSPTDLRHVNRCPDYCQIVLSEIRQHFRKRRAHFGAVAQRLAAHAESDLGSFYDGIVENERGEILGPAKILVTDGPFLTDSGYMVFRIVIAEPTFPPEVMPIELSFGEPAGPESSSPVFTFDLPSQANEILKMKIPASVTKEKIRELDKTGQLPFAFVIRPLGKPEFLCIG